MHISQCPESNHANVQFQHETKRHDMEQNKACAEAKRQEAADALRKAGTGIRAEINVT